MNEKPPLHPLREAPFGEGRANIPGAVPDVSSREARAKHTGGASEDGLSEASGGIYGETEGEARGALPGGGESEGAFTQENPEGGGAPGRQPSRGEIGEDALRERVARQLEEDLRAGRGESPGESEIYPRNARAPDFRPEIPLALRGKARRDPARGPARERSARANSAGQSAQTKETKQGAKGSPTAPAGEKGPSARGGSARAKSEAQSASAKEAKKGAREGAAAEQSSGRIETKPGALAAAQSSGGAAGLSSAKKPRAEERRRGSGGEAALPEPSASAGEEPRGGRPRKRGGGGWVVFAVMFLLVAIVGTFFLLWTLYRDQVELLLHREDGAASGAIASDRPPEPATSGAASGAPAPSPAPDLPSGPAIPSGGFSAKDAALTVETSAEQTLSPDGAPAFTTTLDAPRFSYPANPAAEARITASLIERQEEYAAMALKKAEEFSSGYRAGEEPGSYTLRWSLLAEREDIVTLIATVTQVCGGNPLVTVECGNYSARTGDSLSIGDVVSDLPALADLAIARVDRALVWDGIYEQVIRATICDSWYPTADGLLLIYQTYSVGPGASGTVEVLIPGGDLAGLFALPAGQ